MEYPSLHLTSLFIMLCITLQFADFKKYKSKPKATEEALVDSEIFSSSSGYGGYFQADEASAAAVVAAASSPTQQKCVEIPQNMSLCQGVGYQQMLIPNLLGHETVREASEQAATWIALANIKCHPRTQLFLCSLFAPICPMQQGPQSSDGFVPADQALITSGPIIYPCRSLCESVKEGCLGVMSKHGFPWPDILTCSRFPVDNDMCISLPNPAGEPANSGNRPEVFATTPTTTPLTTPVVFQAKTARTRKPLTSRITVAPVITTAATTDATTATTAVTTSESCPVCNPVVVPEKLDSAYCQANFVAKVRFRRLTRKGVLLVRRPKLLKMSELLHFNRTILDEELKNAKSVEFVFDADKTSENCKRTCSTKIDLRSQLYLVMGNFISNISASSSQLVASGPRKLPLPQMSIHLIMPWFSGPNNRDFRQAEKRLQNLKCSSSRIVDGFATGNVRGTNRKATRTKKPRN